MAAQNKSGKLIAIIVLLLGAVGLGVYLYKNKNGGAAALANAPTVAPWDEALLERLMTYFRQNADAGALSWLTPNARDNYEGTGENIHRDYLINGKVTKSGAFMATYAAQYRWNPKAKFKIDPEAFNDGIYSIFLTEKALQERV